MANGLLNYYNQNGLLQDPSANIARQMTPQMQFRNPLLGMDLSPPPPPQPTFGEQARTAAMGAARGLGNAFTGEGSSARLAALGASLLSGPSRTPISFGSSMAQGLLAGNIAAQQEQERKFKRGLLEREMAVAEAKLKGQNAGNIYNVIKNGQVVSQVLENTPEFLSEVANSQTRLEKIGTTSLGEKNSFVDIYKKDPEDSRYKITQTVRASDAKPFEGNPEYRIVPYGKGYETTTEEQGFDLSKDTRILPDGSVEVIAGSKTAEELNLRKDNLKLSQEELARKQKEFDRTMAFKEAKAQIDADIAERGMKITEAEYNNKVKSEAIKIQNEKIIEQRKQDAAHSSLGQIVRTIDAIEGMLKTHEDAAIGLTGIGSALAEVPLVGQVTPQGVFKNQVDELIGFLTGKGLEKLKSQSRTGATGFGNLSDNELKIIKALEGKLSRATTRAEFERVLNDVKVRFGAAYYGVLGSDGIIEAYSPSKHDTKLFDNSLSVYTPTEKAIQGATRYRYLGQGQPLQEMQVLLAMSDFIEILVGDEVLEFPANTPEAEMISAVESFLSSKEYQSSLPSPDDLTPETKSVAPVIGSATRLMTKPFRELTSTALERPVTRALADIPVAGPTLSATAGLAADAGLLGLGALGTGLAGALSFPVEAYGLLGQPTAGEKRQLARDVMGMMESMPVLGMGYMATRPAILTRAKVAPEQKISAGEFRELGITPPITAKGGAPKAIAQTLEEFPVVGEGISAATARAERQAGEALESLVPKISREKGGAALLRGTDTFIKETKEKAGNLYKKVDELIPAETPVETTNTLKYLEDAVASTKGLPAVEAVIGETKSYRALIKDLTGRKSNLDDTSLEMIEDVFGSLDSLPQIKDPRVKFETLRKIRTSIGESLEDNSGPLAQSLSKASRKKLYAALSQDLEAAAKAAGPKASQAFKNANNYYNARMKRIETAFGKVVKIEDPEQAYRYISDVIKTGGAKESVRIIKALEKSLPEEDFATVTSSIISRLGRKTDDVDEVFDVKTFLDGWSKINPSAKKIFASSAGGPRVYKELEKLARVASKLSDANAMEAGRRLRTRQVASDLGRRATSPFAGGAGVAAGYVAATNFPIQAAIAAVTVFATAKLMGNATFLKAVNSIAENDIGPMRALALSRDFGSTEARAILHSMNMLEDNEKQD